ncbi:FecR family protein [Parapedobacter tibetensis]|uniref:FecR family protein n=1 Tax=Parapedobacter tibetensis TaxID=2972951 RepID=UPI00214DA738|nr:FecR domain-containing protein [Parapedobacter tibetensis]
MDYLTYDVEQFVADETFCQYCLGNNPDAVRFWQEWVAMHPEKKPVVDRAKKLYFALNGDHTDVDFRADFTKFKQVLNQHSSDQKGTIRPPLKPIKTKKLVQYIIAATLLCSIGLPLWLFWKNETQSDNPHSSLSVVETEQYSTGVGERKHIQLPDGSKVMLNARSTLIVASDFNQKTRSIQLSGEAFFEVAHQPTRPFLVNTPHITVKVTGTVFNVKDYPNDFTTETVLLKGSVAVNHHQGNVDDKTNRTKWIELKPNQKLIFPNQAYTAAEEAPPLIVPELTSVVPVATSSLPAEAEWTRNRLIFHDETFEEIALILERWYDVTITFERPALKDERFVGSFGEVPIERILTTLQRLSQFNFRKEGTSIIIY